MEFTKNENERILTDEFNPRIYVHEYRCAGCQEFVLDEDTVWENDKAYHVSCIPEQGE